MRGAWCLSFSLVCLFANAQTGDFKRRDDEFARMLAQSDQSKQFERCSEVKADLVERKAALDRHSELPQPAVLRRAMQLSYDQRLRAYQSACPER